MSNRHVRRLRDRVGILVLSLVALGPNEAALASEPEDRGPRPMTVEDLWAVERVGSPVISPDGTRVAFVLTAYSMEENDSNADLWLASTTGAFEPRRLTRSPKADGSPAFRPDGRALAFTSKRGDGPPQLYELPLDGGEARPLTELPIAVIDPKWLPDGSGLVFLGRTWPDLNDDFDAVRARLEEREQDEVAAKITENRLVRHWDEWETDGRVEHFFHLDLARREVRDLTPGWTRRMDLRSPAGEWDLAPDGSEIVFSANSTDPPYRTWNPDLFSVRLASPDRPAAPPVNRTPANLAADFAPRYAPDGSFLVYLRNERPELHPDFSRLARIDLVAGDEATDESAWGPPRDLTAGRDRSPSSPAVSGDSDTIFFHAQEGGRTHLYAIRADGGEPVGIGEGGVTSGVVAGPSADDSFVVYREESILSPPELVLLRSDETKRRITRFNDERLAALDLGTVESVTYRGHGDQPVQMWVVRPPGFTPKENWPLLVVIHGGPHGATLDRWHTRWNLALFASTGAIVAAPNFHGSTGFGQAFAESILGNHAEKPFADVMLATDYMEGLGYVDRERTMAAGGSYGGYLVSWILGHTDRFAALIDHAGVYDLRSQYSSDATWGRDRNYGASPWTDPDRIDRHSPSRFAAGASTPTLILHGERDYRVPVHQGLMLHGVLTAKGVRSRLVVFPKENHWILTPHGARTWWSEVHAWMREHLGTR